MTNSLISVVIPVYNVEKYLNKCVDSILSQTYENIEVILVDDGSPDSCPKICDDYVKKDNRIRVIHKENGGLSDARNAGLKVVTGEWVSFIDSDDWAEPDFISKLIKTASINNADISVCTYIKEYKDKPSQTMTIGEDKKVMTNIEAMRDLLTYKKYGGVMTWNKLYKTSIFRDNNIEFPVGKIHEDNFTTYKTYYYASKVAYVDTPLLHYRQRDDSIMGVEFDDRRTHAIRAAEETNEFVVEHNLPLANESAFLLMSSIMQCLQALHMSNSYNSYSELERKLFRRLIDIRMNMKSNPYLRTKDRIRLCLAAMPHVYRLINRIGKRMKG